MFVSYKNGNYQVLLNLKNGTKIRYNDEDEIIPNRPESIDVKITNQCLHNCVFCHENSNQFGKVASLEAMKNFAKSLPVYTEIAVGGGDLMLSPVHTEVFLKMLKEVKAIPSITIRQSDFIKHVSLIQEWKKNNLIYGIGISYDDYRNEELFFLLENFPTAVIHVIAGILTEHDYKTLRGHNLKMLILGYKIKGRGSDFWKQEADQISANIKDLAEHFDDFKNDFDTVAFDNLALKQLDVKNKMAQDNWEKYYCGDDGQYTFYVDLVEQQFSYSSTNPNRIDIGGRTVQEMFDVVRDNWR